MPVLLICYHTAFLVQFYINLHLSVYQKAEIALTAAACAISAFWKTHLCKLIQIELETVWLPILIFLLLFLSSNIFLYCKGQQWFTCQPKIDISDSTYLILIHNNAVWKIASKLYKIITEARGIIGYNAGSWGRRLKLPALYPIMLRAEVIIYYNYWSSSKPIVFCLQLYHRMSPPFIIIMENNESNNSWRSMMFLFKVTVT